MPFHYCLLLKRKSLKRSFTWSGRVVDVSSLVEMASVPLVV